MKFLGLFIFLSLFISCASFEKQAQDNPTALYDSSSSQRIVKTLRRVASLEKDDFSFIFEKMKTVISNYKELKNKLYKLEKKFNSLVAQNTLKKEESKLELLTEEKISDDQPLFDENFLKNDSEELKNSERTLAHQESDDLFSQARELFQKGVWESAISQFQKYREKYPQGLYYLEATYYMGEAFRNLNMTPESHIFYKEILDSYPESDWASKAKARLNP